MLANLTNTARRLKHKAIARGFFFDFPNNKDVIFLASSGRSGSTWIEGIIASSNEFRVLFEPFERNQTKSLSQWQYYQYIPKDFYDYEFYRAARNIIEGRIRNRWIDQDAKLLFPKKRLIKDIRVNFFIAWLKKNFPDIQLVLLLRSPFSVASSRVDLGWPPEIAGLLTQESLVNTHFANDIDFLKSVEDPFVKQIAFWSMQNIVPLRELSGSDAFVLAYEDLVHFPAQELERLTSHLKISPPPLSMLGKQSRTSNPSRRKYSPTSEQIAGSMHVLKRFSLDLLYPDEKPNPPKFFERDILSMYPMPLKGE